MALLAASSRVTLVGLLCSALPACTWTTDLDFVGPAQSWPHAEAGVSLLPDEPVAPATSSAASTLSQGASVDTVAALASSAASTPGDAGTQPVGMSNVGQDQPDASVVGDNEALSDGGIEPVVEAPRDSAVAVSPSQRRPADAASRDVDLSRTDADTQRLPDAGVDPAVPEPGPCVATQSLFSDDFESGAFDAWTSFDVGPVACQTSGYSSTTAAKGARSFESRITCSSASGFSHNAALQFSGDVVRDSHSDQGTGIDAPYGVVVQSYIRLESPSAFENGRWVGLILIAGACDWSDDVLSLGLDDASDRLSIGHSEAGGGSRSYAADAPVFPRGQWVQVTVYINYYDSVLMVWQDGMAVTRADFVRPGKTLCHVRLGLYASPDNDDVTVFHDSVSVRRLQAPLTDLTVPPCD